MRFAFHEGASIELRKTHAPTGSTFEGHANIAGFDRKRHITELLGRSPGIRHAYKSKRLRHQFSQEYQTVLDALVKDIDDAVGPDGLYVTESEYPHVSNVS